MANIEISGRNVPLDQITEVYSDSYGRFMAVVFGESDVEIDAASLDEMIELVPHIVEEKLINERKEIRTMAAG